MKRLCVLILALAMVSIMVAPAFATWTRVATMGNQAQFIQDDHNIWTFTSTVNNYPRHLIIDHSIDADSYEFGVTEDIDGGTRLGMIVPFMGHSVIGAFVSDFDFDWGLNPSEADQKIDLFYGYRGASFDLGVRIDYSGRGVEFGGKQNQSALGLNAGVGFNLSGNMLEVNGLYRSISWTNETLSGPTAPTVINEKDAGSDMGLSARYLIAYNSMVTLVPAFMYRSQKVAEKITAGSTTGVEAKTTGWDLGVACNTVPLQGTEFLTSFGVRSINNEVTDTAVAAILDESDGHMPYISFGSEIQVKNWLQFRFGAEKSWDSFTDNATSPETKSSGASFDYHVGAGIMTGDLQWDVEVNPSWFNAGPYLLSGENAGDMFLNISIKYDYR